MELLHPATWEEALEAKAAHPDAVPIAGGTDLMVEMNFDRRRPEHRVLGPGHRRLPASRFDYRTSGDRTRKRANEVLLRRGEHGRDDHDRPRG